MTTTNPIWNMAQAIGFIRLATGLIARNQLPQGTHAVIDNDWLMTDIRDQISEGYFRYIQRRTNRSSNHWIEP